MFLTTAQNDYRSTSLYYKFYYDYCLSAVTFDDLFIEKEKNMLSFLKKAETSITNAILNSRKIFEC